MIEVIDRIPTYPGRVKMTPVEGQENTYDMVRADDPVVVGTPINKALFDSYATKINAVAQSVDDKIFALSQRVQLGSLPIGGVFGLYENGVLVPYVKVRNAFRTAVGRGEGSNALVLRLNIAAMMPLYESARAPMYEGSRIDSWLENEFFNTLDAATKSVIPQVYIQVLNSTGGINEPQRKVFLLSMNEYGFDNSTGFTTLGGIVEYFDGGSRNVANYEGTPVAHYTRSTKRASGGASVINVVGNYEAVSETTVAGVRPAFTLPSAYEVTAIAPSVANTHVTAEVIE